MAACSARIDRREIGRAGREGLVVADLEAVFLRVLPRALAGVAREFGVLGGERQRLRLRILFRRDLEEPFGERFSRRLAGRQHREVFRVMELAVDIERKQPDESLAPLHDDRHGGRVHVGGIGPDDKVDFVDVEELRVDARHRRRIGLVVVIDQLDLASEQSAFGVDFRFPDLGAEQRLLAVRRERAGERQAKADLDRLAGLRGCGRGRRRQGADDGGNADHADDAAPCDAMTHDFLPMSSVFRFTAA